MIRLIIPAYDEAGPLQSLLSRLPSTLSGHDVVTLVVSDGSTDSTVQVARDAGIETMALSHNRGKGTAIRAAVTRLGSTEYDLAVLMDADGQHDPADLEALVAPLIASDSDISLGSRYLASEGRGSTPMNRYMIRWLTVVVLERILGTRFTDPYCGFRAFTREAIEGIDLQANRYEAELEMLFEAFRGNLLMVEVPVEKVYGVGMSKMSEGGRLLGRMRVIRQYATTIVRKTRQLRAHKSKIGAAAN